MHNTDGEENEVTSTYALIDPEEEEEDERYSISGTSKHFIKQETPERHTREQVISTHTQ